MSFLRTPSMTESRAAVRRTMMAIGLFGAACLPGIASAQGVSSGAASVALRVIVLPRVSPVEAVQTVSEPEVRGRSRGHLDLVTNVVVAEYPAARIAVQLPQHFAEESGAGLRVFVRDAAGTYRRLEEGTPVVIDEGIALPGEARRQEVSFRVEADDPALLASLALPISYHLMPRHDAMTVVRVTATLQQPAASFVLTASR